MRKTQNPSAIRSRKEISEALLKLMQEHPYSDISVKQIVMETKLVRKTFYLNFTSKDDVLESIVNEKILEYIQALSDSNTSPLSVIFEFCDYNKDFLLLLHKNKMLYFLLARLNEFIPEYKNKNDMSSNPFAKLIGNLESDYLIAFNIGAIWNVVFKWIDNGMVDSLEDIKYTIKEYLKQMKTSLII